MSTKTVNVLCIGDLHVSPKTLHRSIEFMDKLEAYIENTDIRYDFAVVLGDVFDRHENIHTKCICYLNDLLGILTLYYPTFLLVGNHDMVNNTCFLDNTSHPFGAYKMLLDCTIVDKVCQYTIKGMKFTFVPYVYPGRFTEALDTLYEEKKKWEDSKAIFAHQEFKGSKLGPIDSWNGDDWSKNKNLPLIISGHIHEFDEMYRRNLGNVIYTGSSVQHTFAERPNKAITHFQFGSLNLPFKYKRTVGKCRFAFIRYRLPLSKKLTIEVQSESEIDMSTFKEGMEYRLIYTSSHVGCKNFKKSKIYKDLIDRSIKVILTTTSSTIRDHLSEDGNLTFEQIFINMVKNSTTGIIDEFNDLPNVPKIQLPRELVFEDSSEEEIEEGDESSETIELEFE